VTKPAQYVGGEHNQAETTGTDADSRWLLCYPDTYEVGQPNQGIQILYEVLNARSATLAERLYAPWVDLEERMREHGIPAFSLEAHRPVWAFDVLGVTLPHELGHTNLLNLLDLGAVPIHAEPAHRGGPDRAGGRSRRLQPGAARALHRRRGDGRRRGGRPRGRRRRRRLEAGARGREGAGPDRHELLRRLAAVEGVYVPAFYTPRYTDDGRLKATVATEPGVPARVPKRTVQDLEQWPYPQKQLVPMTETVHERFSVEIFRAAPAAAASARRA
jgi:hypothetical protein